MSFPLWPWTASAYAHQVDILLLFLWLLAAALSVPVVVALGAFALRYRAGREVNREHRPSRNITLEVSWALIPFLLTLVFFTWAAKLYFEANRPPPGALEISVLARQWMWKFQHPGGQREINELHVPVNRPVKFTMISEDVIHSLYFPALRIKQDVLPARYTTLWFDADVPGTYKLLCAEFCGTSHSEMGGQIIVMEPADYERWLERTPSDLSLAARGANLFRSLGCSGCHVRSEAVDAPPLWGVFGGPVPLSSGQVIVADEGYIRDSILLPKKAVVAGYRPIMPTFEGRVSEEQLIQLIAYIKSLANDEGYPQ
jgi:cytochrome c oxidase subunit 2